MNNFNSESKAILLMILTAIEDIINSNGNVSDDVFEELKFVFPQFEKILFSEV